MAKRSETTDCGSIAEALDDAAVVISQYESQQTASWGDNNTYGRRIHAAKEAVEKAASLLRSMECRSVAETPWTSVAPVERTPGPLDALVDMDPEALRALVEEAVREAAPILKANKGVFDATVSGETWRRVVGGRRRPKATEQESVFSAEDLRSILEWHEEVRTTCGISAADDNLRQRIVGALRVMEEKSVGPGGGEAEAPD